MESIVKLLYRLTAALCASALICAVLLCVNVQASWASEASDDTTGIDSSVILSETEGNDSIVEESVVAEEVKSGIASDDSNSDDEEDAINDDIDNDTDVVGDANDDVDSKNSEVSSDDSVDSSGSDDSAEDASVDTEADGESDESAVAGSDADTTDTEDGVDAAAQGKAEVESDVDVAVQTETTASEDDTITTTTYVNMYRLYNPNSGEHFYTSSLDEAMSVTGAGWQYEGVGWVAPSTSSTPVYRLYNPNAGDHHYTVSADEHEYLVSVGWNDEGIGWYSDDSGTGIAVLRQYNPNAVAGAHNFTTSSAENKNLVSIGWNGEGVAWYAANQSTQTIQGRWIVASSWGSLERYWLDSSATIAKSRLIDPTTNLDSGAGYRAYATSTGAVVRGSLDSGAGYVYLADNDGCLVSGTADSWLVTDKFAGSLQRYYLVSIDGIVVAKTSVFTVEGSHYYGRANVGYVVRGKLLYGAGMLVADNEGALAWTEGWLVTDIYDGVMQRYRIDSAPGDGLMGAHIGLFELDGNKYYGRDDEGYVVRGYWIASGGQSYYADNDGVLDEYYWLTEAGRNLWSRIANMSSGTQYLIAVDVDNFRTVIFQGSQGSWTPLYDWLCGTGILAYHDGQGTPRGAFMIGGDGADPYWADGGCGTYKTAYQSTFAVSYMTCFVLNLGFHSTTPYDEQPPVRQLGKHVSHGCIRLLSENAKWIYDNCLYGTTVLTV